MSKPVDPAPEFMPWLGPGDPYTPQERASLDDLLRGALDAEAAFDLNELEAYAEAHRDKTP